jgi:hypothetical protein
MHTHLRRPRRRGSTGTAGAGNIGHASDACCSRIAAILVELERKAAGAKTSVKLGRPVGTLVKGYLQIAGGRSSRHIDCSTLHHIRHSRIAKDKVKRPEKGIVCLPRTICSKDAQNEKAAPKELIYDR